MFSSLVRRSRLPRFTYRGFYSDSDTLEPFHPIPGRAPEHISASEALRLSVQSGNRVFIHSAASSPQPLVDALVDLGKTGLVKDVNIVHIHTEGSAQYADKQFVEQGIFRTNCLFTGGNMRVALNLGLADFTPIFLREIPVLFRKNVLPIDVALISVSPADKHGYHSLGVSVDITRAALQSAKIIIALVNDKVPRTFGDGFIHNSHFNYVIEQSVPLFAKKQEVLGPVEQKIGEIIAENLVDDGACLQMYEIILFLF
jgi:acyl-CoA hydrolase